MVQVGRERDLGSAGPVIVRPVHLARPMGTSIGEPIPRSARPWRRTDPASRGWTLGLASVACLTIVASAWIGLLGIGFASSSPFGHSAPGSSPRAAPTPASVTYPTPIRHVFVVYLENEELSSVQSNGPFEMHLANTYASASSYYSPCHPSAPNYLASTAGATLQCGSDNYNTYTTQNIFGLAQAAGLSWGDFSESMPQACYTQNTFPNGLYVAHHNPAIYFKNIVGNSTLCKSHDVSFSGWYNDVNNSAIPTLAFFAPNMDNDGHQTGTAYADKWLKGWLSPYLNASWFNSSVWFVLWDEGTTNNGPGGSSGGGHVFFSAVSPYSRGGLVWNSTSQHYNLLTTEEWLLGMSSKATGNNDNWSTYSPMRGLFKFSTPLSATASATPTSGSSPLSVAFNGSATGGTSPYSYSWAFGDGGTSSSQSPSHSYSSSGSYTANLTVTDAKKNTSTSSVTITVSKPSALSASVSASPVSGSAPLAVSFTATASGGSSPYSYAWSFGDGGSSTVANPSHSYTSAGNYTATLTVTDSASSKASASTAITVKTSSGPLAASVTASPTSGPAPLFVQFHASVSGGVSPYSYSWQFAVCGTKHSSLASPNDTYLFAGSYTATVTVTDSAGHTSTAQVSITVTAAGSGLSATAAATPTIGTAPLAVVFIGTATGGSSPYTYFWTFGDGTSSTSQNPNHSYVTTGNYTVTLTVTDAAKSVATSSLVVRAIAAAPLTVSASASPTSGAGPLTVRFTGTASGGSPPYSYYWTYSVGGTRSSTNPNTNDTYYYAGTYTATLKVTDSLGHTASAQLKITVNSTAPGYAQSGGVLGELSQKLQQGLASLGQASRGALLVAAVALIALAAGLVVVGRRPRRPSPKIGSAHRSP